jgi:hypothetical protein
MLLRLGLIAALVFAASGCSVADSADASDGRSDYDSGTIDAVTVCDPTNACSFQYRAGLTCNGHAFVGFTPCVDESQAETRIGTCYPLNESCTGYGYQADPCVIGDENLACVSSCEACGLHNRH